MLKHLFILALTSLIVSSNVNGEGLYDQTRPVSLQHLFNFYPWQQSTPAAAMASRVLLPFPYATGTRMVMPQVPYQPAPAYTSRLANTSPLLTYTQPAVSSRVSPQFAVDGSHGAFPVQAPNTPLQITQNQPFPQNQNMQAGSASRMMLGHIVNNPAVLAAARELLAQYYGYRSSPPPYPGNFVPTLRMSDSKSSRTVGGVVAQGRLGQTYLKRKLPNYQQKRMVREQVGKAGSRTGYEIDSLVRNTSFLIPGFSVHRDAAANKYSKGSRALYSLGGHADEARHRKSVGHRALYDLTPYLMGNRALLSGNRKKIGNRALYSSKEYFIGNRAVLNQRHHKKEKVHFPSTVEPLLKGADSSVTRRKCLGTQAPEDQTDQKNHGKNTRSGLSR